MVGGYGDDMGLAVHGDSRQRTRRARRALTAVLALGVLTTGCVASIEPDAGAPPAASAAPTTAPRAGTNPSGTAASGPEADTNATVMRMPLVGGGEIDFAAYLNQPLLLWFWAPF